MTLIGLDVETQLVGRQSLALIVEAPRAAEDVVVFKEVAVVLDVAVDAAEHTAHHRLVDRFDEGIETFVAAVYIQPSVRLTRRGNADAREETHRHGLFDPAEIL